eukprot:15702_1
MALADHGGAHSYFFESVGKQGNANVSIAHELDSVKIKLSEQRRNHRDHCSKKSFLQSIRSSDLHALFQQDMNHQLKKAKETNKQIKQQTTLKKDEKRKLHKKCEKYIAEILKLKKEIEKRKADLVRLSSESNALQNKHQKQINDVNHNTKYNISQLIEPFSCKNILNQQQQLLQKHNADFRQQNSLLSAQRSINKQLAQQRDDLRKQHETHESLLAIQQSENTNHAQGNNDLRKLQHEWQSLKRLFGFKRFEVHQNQLVIEYESISKEIYLIQIQLEQLNTQSVCYSIQSVQIMNNNTRFNEISEFIISKYNVSKDNDRVMVHLPFIGVSALVGEIILMLKKLPPRYRDIRRLYEIYGSNDKQNMLPWLPENGQLVFKFSFKQSVTVSGNESDDDRKMAEDTKVVSILVDIPLVISMAWSYPNGEFVNDDGVITIEHYNCSLNGKQHEVNVSQIEGQWNDVLQKTVDEMKRRFQNDIVRFVNYLHDQLQQFADSNQ